MIQRILWFGVSVCLAVSAACAQSPEIRYGEHDPRCKGHEDTMYKLENLNKKKTVYALMGRRLLSKTTGRGTDAPELPVTVPPGQTIELFCIENENEKIYMTVNSFHY
jgi:hypothetical protein